MNNIIKNHYGGTVLLMTLLILMSILVVTLTAGEIVRMGLIMSRTQVHSTKAYYASEAGAERILWEIRKNSFSPAVCNNGDNFCFTADPGDIDTGGDPCSTTCAESQQTLSNESFYQIVYDYSVPITTLTCLGDYEEIRRVVELKY